MLRARIQYLRYDLIILIKHLHTLTNIIKFRLWLVVHFDDTVIVLRDKDFWLTKAIGLYLLSDDGLNDLSQQ